MTAARQINCYIPIKLRITGRLNDAQLDALVASLSHAISARLAQARHAIGHDGHASVQPTFGMAREAFDPARLNARRYGLPSYDEAGKTVDVPVEDSPEELWQNEADEAARLATESASASDRAFRQRLSLLLNELRPDVFTSEAQVLKFIRYCHQNAASEADTLNVAAFGKLSRQDALDDYGAGFPNAWADRVYQDFHTDVDLDALKHAYESRVKDARSIAAGIPAELWARGLPLSIVQARQLRQNEIATLVLGRHRLKESSREVTNAYAQALFRSTQANAHYSFVNNYQSHIIYSRDLLRRGEVIGDRALHNSLTKAFDDFRQSLQHFEHGEMEELIYRGYVWVDISNAYATLGQGYHVSGDGIDVFWKQIRIVDLQIASTGANDCLSRAFTWAFERDFFDAAGLEVWESIKENGWRMLITAAAIFGVQFVPGLNVAVDIVLIIEFGFDVLSTLADLKTALTDAGSAKSVLDMPYRQQEVQNNRFYQDGSNPDFPFLKDQYLIHQLR